MEPKLPDADPKPREKKNVHNNIKVNDLALFRASWHTVTFLLIEGFKALRFNAHGFQKWKDVTEIIAVNLWKHCT